MTSAVDAKRTKGPGGGGGGAGAGGGVVSAGDLAAAIEVVAGFVGAFEPGRFSGEDAITLVTWFTRAEHLCVTGKALAATRAAEANAPAAAGQPTPAHWLAGVTGESIGEAAGTLRLGASFSSHPSVEDACRRGELSKAKATLVADAARVSPGSEDDLVRSAPTDTFRQVKDRCARVKAQARSSGDADAHYRSLHRSRYARTWTDRDGAFRLDARLTPDAGATLLASLTTRADAEFTAARRAGIHDTPDHYRADALVTLVTAAGDADRADAGGSGVGAPAVDSSATTTPTRRRTVDPKTLVTLRVDLDALRRGSLGPGELCEIPGVGPIPIQRARALMGDSICHLVITNGVDITTVCHLGRTVPAHLRTALTERDRTCVVPGCDVAQGLEIDHWVIPVEDGGPASMDNLVRICRHHHRLRHHQGFTLSGAPGAWRWDPPGAASRPPPEEHPHPTDTDTDHARPQPLFTLEE
jgi:hypothetical protein